MLKKYAKRNDSMTTNKKHQDEFKSVKQRLSAIQLVIKRELKDGRLPRVDDVDHFIATSREMERLCQNEWRVAMDNYIDRLEVFGNAINNGELQAIENAFHELLDCKNACHKEFRQP
jgi:XXXCH domain-containing protein